MFVLPLRLLQGLIFRPLNKLQQAQYDYVQKGDLRIPMFFAEPASRDSMHTVPPSILFFVGVVVRYLDVYTWSHLFLASTMPLPQKCGSGKYLRL